MLDYLTDFCDTCGEEMELDTLHITDSEWVCPACDEDYWQNQDWCPLGSYFVDEHFGEILHRPFQAGN